MNTIITSRCFRGILATAALGSLTCSLATVCVAAEPTDMRQMTVKYTDLNVSSPQGAATLYARIQWAARQVCPVLDVRNLNSDAHAACIHKAIADAVAKVDQPTLFIEYNAHNGQPTPIVLASTQRR